MFFFMHGICPTSKNPTFAKFPLLHVQSQKHTMTFPDNCQYTKDHEWIRLEGDGTAYVGITDFAQGELGELVYIEVETVGETVEANTIFGTVEAVKTTSDLFMPVTAEVLEFNPALDESKGGESGLLNEDPYIKGWIVRIKPTNIADVTALMSADEYKGLIGQ